MSRTARSQRWWAEGGRAGVAVAVARVAQGRRPGAVRHRPPAWPRASRRARRRAPARRAERRRRQGAAPRKAAPPPRRAPPRRPRRAPPWFPPRRRPTPAPRGRPAGAGRVARRPVIRRQRARVPRFEAARQTVEKSAPPARRPGEQAVHRRGEPEHREAFGERRLAPRRLPVDTHRAPRRAGLAAGADLGRARPPRPRAPRPPMPRPPARRGGAGRRGGPRAGRVRARAATPPRAGWSCRRRWGRSAPPARGRTRGAGRDSCGIP